MEFMLHTLPQGTDMVYAKDSVQGKGTLPKLGESGPGSYVLHAPHHIMIQNAHWCHNAGGVWLTPEYDIDTKMSGWACVKKSTESGKKDTNGDVALDGGDFSGLQAELGLPGKTSILGDSITQSYEVDEDNIIDYYDCVEAESMDTYAWQPVQNQPCHECDWTDIWGGYAANHLNPIALATDFLDFLKGLDLTRWVVVIVILLVACCACYTACSRVFKKATGG